MEELGWKWTVRVKGSEIESEKVWKPEMEGLRGTAQCGSSDLKLIGQISLCSAGVDLDVICSLL